MMNRRSVLAGGGAVVLAGTGAAWLGLRGMGSMADYESAMAATRALLPVRAELADLVHYATLAPNGHNAQPWRFRLAEGRIDVLPDPTRRTPVVDPDDHHLFVGLGSAAENLSLAGAARGRPGELAFEPANGGSITFVHGTGDSRETDLFGAIRMRQSTRADYDGRPVGAAALRSLVEAARVPGVDMVLITERSQMDRVRDLVVEGNSAQMADPAFVRELKSWIRYSPRQAMTRGDGLFSVVSGSPALPEWLGPTLFNATFKPKAENDKYAGHIRSSSGLAVFVGEREDPDHWTRVGRASQRFALQATALGLKHAYINQPVEVAALRPALAGLVGLSGRRPDLLMRFGYGPTLPFSARRPAAEVIVP